MSAVIGGIQVVLSDDVSRFRSGFSQLASMVEAQGNRTRRAIDGVTAAQGRLSDSLSGFGRLDAFRALSISALRAENSLTRLRTVLLAVTALAGGGGAAFSVKALTDYADTYTSILNRLRAVLDTQQQVVVAERELFNIAQRTRSEFGSTVTLFARMQSSAEQMGVSTNQMLRVVETVQKSFVIGGARTNEAQSAAIQLTQAIGSGRLQGDELRSILENNIPLAKVLAKELSGGNVGALKEMGSEGLLTTEKVINAILKNSRAIDEAFGKTQPRVEDALQGINNAMVRYLGSTDQAAGYTAALSTGLSKLANNFESVGNSIMMVIGALGAVGLGRLAGRGGAALGQVMSIANPMNAARNSIEAARLVAAQAKAEREAAAAALAAAKDNAAAIATRSQNPANFYTASQVRQRIAIERELNEAIKAHEVTVQRADKAEAALNKTIAARQAALAELQRQQSGPQALLSPAAQKILSLSDRSQVQLAAIQAAKDERDAQAEVVRRSRQDLRTQELLSAASSTQRTGTKEPENTARAARQAYEAERKIGDAKVAALAAAGEAYRRTQEQIAAATAALDARLQTEADARALKIAAAQREVAQAQARLNDINAGKYVTGVTAQSAQARADRRFAEVDLVAKTRALEEQKTALEAVAAAETQMRAQAYAAEAAQRKAAFAETDRGRAMAVARAAGVALLGGLSSIVSFLGGPLGVAVTAATGAMIAFEMSHVNAARAAERHKSVLEGLAGALKKAQDLRTSGEGVPAAEAAAQMNAALDAEAAARQRLGVFLERKDVRGVQGILMNAAIYNRKPGENFNDVAEGVQKLEDRMRGVTVNGAEGSMKLEELVRVLDQAAQRDPSLGKIALRLKAVAADAAFASDKVGKFVDAMSALSGVTVGRGASRAPGSDFDLDATFRAAEAQERRARKIFDDYKQIREAFTERLPPNEELAQANEKLGVGDARRAAETAIEVAKLKASGNEVLAEWIQFRAENSKVTEEVAKQLFFYKQLEKTAAAAKEHEDERLRVSRETAKGFADAAKPPAVRAFEAAMEKAGPHVTDPFTRFKYGLSQMMADAADAEAERGRRIADAEDELRLQSQISKLREESKDFEADWAEFASKHKDANQDLVFEVFLRQRAAKATAEQRAEQERLFKLQQEARAEIEALYARAGAPSQAIADATEQMARDKKALGGGKFAEGLAFQKFIGNGLVDIARTREAVERRISDLTEQNAQTRLENEGKLEEAIRRRVDREYGSAPSALKDKLVAQEVEAENLRKRTEREKQVKQITDELFQSQLKLTASTRELSAAEVAAAYPLATDEQRKQLVLMRERVEAIAEAKKAYDSLAESLATLTSETLAFSSRFGDVSSGLARNLDGGMGGGRTSAAGFSAEQLLAFNAQLAAADEQSTRVAANMRVQLLDVLAKTGDAFVDSAQKAGINVVSVGELRRTIEDYTGKGKEGENQTNAFKDALMALSGTRMDLSQVISAAVKAAGALAEAAKAARDMRAALAGDEMTPEQQNRAALLERATTWAAEKKTIDDAARKVQEERLKALKEIEEQKLKIKDNRAYEIQKLMRDRNLPEDVATKLYDTTEAAKEANKKEKKKGKTEEERFDDRVARLREEGRASFFTEQDRDLITELKNMKSDPKLAKQTVDAILAGKEIPEKAKQVRDALDLKDAGKLSREIVTNYGTWAQLAPMVAERERILQVAVENGAISLEQKKTAIADYLAQFKQFKWIDSVANSLSELTTSLITEPKKWKDHLQKALKDLQKIAIDELVASPLKQAIKNFLAEIAKAAAGGNLGGAGGIINLIGQVFGSMSLDGGGAGAAGWSIGGVKGNAAAVKFHGGGVVGRSRGAGTVRLPSSILGALPRFHSGLGGDEVAAVLQRGEQVLTRAAAGRTASTMSGLASAVQARENSAGPMEVQVVNKTGVAAKGKAVQDGRVLKIILNAVAADIADGGVIGRAVSMKGR